MTIDIPMNVAPSGLPRCRRCFCAAEEADTSTLVGESDLEDDGERRLVFSRKSWVMAMPMDANERDVRSQARKVRSITRVGLAFVAFLRLYCRHGNVCVL